MKEKTLNNNPIQKNKWEILKIANLAKKFLAKLKEQFIKDQAKVYKKMKKMDLDLIQGAIFKQFIQSKEF